MASLVKKTTAIHILTNISKSKDKQATKFDQLIEYSMRNISLEKSFSLEPFPRPFFTKSKLSISLDQ